MALAAARSGRPDLVITDVMMPGLDGFGLLRELRQDPQTATIPVIMLSARAGEEARVEGIQAGADDYLVKPFGARELKARVSGHIELARARREAAAADERAALVLESITDAFIALDSDWRLTYTNAAAERIIGFSRWELLGKSHWDVFPASVGTNVEAEFRRAMDRTGQRRIRELRPAAQEVASECGPIPLERADYRFSSAISPTGSWPKMRLRRDRAAQTTRRPRRAAAFGN